MFATDETRGPGFAILDDRDWRHPNFAKLGAPALRLVIAVRRRTRTAGDSGGDWAQARAKWMELAQIEHRNQYRRARDEIEEHGFLKIVPRYMPALGFDGRPVKDGEGHYVAGKQVASRWASRSPCEDYDDTDQDVFEIVDHKHPGEARVLEVQVREPRQVALPMDNPFQGGTNRAPVAGAQIVPPDRHVRGHKSCPPDQEPQETTDQYPPNPPPAGGAKIAKSRPISPPVFEAVCHVIAETASAHPDAGIWRSALDPNPRYVHNVRNAIRSGGLVACTLRVREVERAMRRAALDYFGADA